MNAAFSFCACQAMLIVTPLPYCDTILQPLFRYLPIPVFFVQSSEMLSLSVSDTCTLQICKKYLDFVLNLYLGTDFIDLLLSQ